MRVLSKTDEFLALEPQFNAILRSSGSDHVQCTFEWLSLWFRHFGKESKLHVLVAEEGGRVCGVAPLMLHTRPAVYRGLVKLRALSFIGYGFTDRSDFVISPEGTGASREQVMSALFDRLFQDPHLWDEVLLTQLTDASPNFASIRKETDRGGYDVETETLIACPYVDTGTDFDTYYKGLRTNLKHDVARKLRRLAEQGLEPDFEVVTRVDDAVLLELQELNRKRFEATGHRSFFLREDRFAFLRELAAVFSERQWWLLFLFRIKGRLVAYHLCFVYNGTVYNWNTSYDLEYSQYSLGKILLKPVLQFCFEKGYRVFDFMAGDEDYKLKWTGKMTTNYQIAVRRRNLKTGLMKGYSSLKRTVRRAKPGEPPRPPHSPGTS